jgi:hypothetical protein
MSKPSPQAWLFAGGECLGATRYGWMNTATGIEVRPTEEFRMNHPKEYARFMACHNPSSFFDFGTHHVGAVGGPKTIAQINEAIKKGEATPVNQ